MIYSLEVTNLADIANCYYGEGHVMKPHRIRMAHQLIMGYGLYQHLQVYVSFHIFDEKLHYIKKENVRNAFMDQPILRFTHYFTCRCETMFSSEPAFSILVFVVRSFFSAAQPHVFNEHVEKLLSYSRTMSLCYFRSFIYCMRRTNKCECFCSN